MVAYQRFNDGEMEDYIPTDEELKSAMGSFRKSKGSVIRETDSR